MGLAFCKNGHLISGIDSYRKGMCRECMAESSKRWRLKNRNHVSAYAKIHCSEYYEKNKQKIKEKTKENRTNKIDHYREVNRAKGRHDRENLADHYVASRMGFHVKDIPREIIDLKRQQIILKRELKDGINKNGK